MSITAAEHWITDLSIAQPRDALALTPTQDRWVLLPYDGPVVRGQMLWSPSRNNPPDLTIPLPAAGWCRIHLGLYSSSTWPWWFNLIGRYGQRKSWIRLHARLSDDEAMDVIVPENYPHEERLGYITETCWRTAELRGQGLVIAPPRKEAFLECNTFLAYLRLVPVTEPERWPTHHKRLVTYFDSNFYGHFVDSAADIRSLLNPLADSDFHTLFWTTSREDSCYYPTKVGNVLPRECMRGVYPYWAGRDLHRMLQRGEDPLHAVCQIGHRLGLKVFASYRRMTCRMPPFVFPLHPEAMLVKRPDLWCVDAEGRPLPHLSLAYPEVRRRMIDLLVEQATGYDIDGVHFYFSRGVPFVGYEKPALEAYERLHGIGGSMVEDERLWRARAECFTELLAELRRALDEVGQRKGKRLAVAMHVQNTVRNCLYYGIDVAELARRGLVDILLPDHGHFLPDSMGAKLPGAADVAAFVAAARGTAMHIVPHLGLDEDDPLSMLDQARTFFDAGAHGLHPGHVTPVKFAWQVVRRLGHLGEYDAIRARAGDWTRVVRFDRLAGLSFDMRTGVTTCG